MAGKDCAGMIDDRSDYETVCGYYERYEQKAYVTAYAVLGDVWQAEEAVQETFLRLIQHRGTVRYMPEKKRCAYVMKTVKNIAIDMYRRNKKSPQTYGDLEAEVRKEDDGRAPVGADYDPGFCQAEDREMVGRLLDRLAGDDALVLQLRVMRELSVRETAAIMCISEAAVRKKQERALKKAGAILGKEAKRDEGC